MKKNHADYITHSKEEKSDTNRRALARSVAKKVVSISAETYITK